eukprot:1136764-Pelagomonas_calceolata.AAC.11
MPHYQHKDAGMKSRGQERTDWPQAYTMCCFGSMANNGSCPWAKGAYALCMAYMVKAPWAKGVYALCMAYMFKAPWAKGVYALCMA